MDPTARIERMIAPTLESMGFTVVRVRFTGGDRPVLQIMAERTADGRMNVDDCAEVSGVVSALLDVEDPIPGHYDLEVSSPGLDRPLVRIGDFERFAGFEAKVEMAEPVDGRKRFRGRLLGVTEGMVRIASDQGEFALPYSGIATAKLVITDDLIEASLKQQHS
jgi:ribosome maturation factor RimP